MTPRYSDTCIWCDADVDPDKTIDLDDVEAAEQDRDLLTMVMDGDVSARDLIGVKKVLPVIEARPEILKRLDELISLLKRLDDDKMADDGAEVRFVGALLVAFVFTLPL